MKNFKTLFLTIALHMGMNAYGGYDCYQLTDNEDLGRVVVNVRTLEEDPPVLSSLRSPLWFEGATFIKYQFWADAGDGFSVVHFVGVEDSLNEEGEAVLATKDLLCKNDGSVEEGGL
jgi:hypothetical protein